MQQISVEQAPRRSNVDIIVGDGSNAHHFDEYDRLRAGEGNQAPCPIPSQDAETNTRASDHDPLPAGSRSTARVRPAPDSCSEAAHRLH